jgi:hypothetical protein
MRVIAVNPHTDGRWKHFVASHPGGSIYHHPAWLMALEKEYGQKGLHLACEGTNGEYLAVLPLLYTRGLPFNSGGMLAGRRLSSLPRTPVAGPLSTDQRATIAVVQAAIDQIRDDRRIQLQIKSQGPELTGMLEGVGCTPWRLSYVLRLPGATQTPYRIADSHDRAKIRWAINKAIKMDVSIRPAETETDLQHWYVLYLDTMRRNAVPSRPYRFFAALWEFLQPQGLMQLLLAEKSKQGHRSIIAGSIFFMFGRTVSYAFNGSAVQDMPLRPNDFIQWHAINDACKRGFDSFDFGEVPAGHSALAKFKSKWGSEPTRLYRYYYPARDQAPDEILEVKSRGGLLLEGIWRRLPLDATAWLSDRIFSYL